MRRRGYDSIESYLPDEECERLLQAVAEHEARHGLPLVSREAKPRPLLYQVIDGHTVRAHLPEVADLYARVRALAERRAGRRLVPLDDAAADVNVNVTPPGGAYRWHYDRNHVTAILYLNDVVGGEIELHPNHRLLLPRGRLGRRQRWLDRVMATRVLREAIGKKVVVRPRPGLLLLLRGDRCLHSVRAVEGDAKRVAIVMAFDLPAAARDRAEQLDTYLYTDVEVSSPDPNYSS